MKFLKRADKPDLAYVHSAGSNDLPPVMFLGGFKSDMEGTKALYLEELCQERKQEFIRFDYSGHGQSQGKFEEGCISDWMVHSYAVLSHCTSRPAILVGSSMGGWISLLMGIHYPKHVQAIIGLAAAPDFTVWMEDKMTDAQKEALDIVGQFDLPNDYDAPYVITNHLIEDGRKNILLNGHQKLSMPLHLIQGKKDADVPWKTAERIKENLGNDRTQITYIEEADHRLSEPDQLMILGEALKTISV